MDCEACGGVSRFKLCSSCAQLPIGVLEKAIKAEDERRRAAANVVVSKPAATVAVQQITDTTDWPKKSIVVPEASQGPLTLSEIRKRARAKMAEIEKRFKELDTPES